MTVRQLVDEISYTEFVHWLAFFGLENALADEAAKKQQRIERVRNAAKAARGRR